MAQLPVASCFRLRPRRMTVWGFWRDQLRRTSHPAHERRGMRAAIHARRRASALCVKRRRRCGRCSGGQATAEAAALRRAHDRVAVAPRGRRPRDRLMQGAACDVVAVDDGGAWRGRRGARPVRRGAQRDACVLSRCSTCEVVHGQLRGSGLDCGLDEAARGSVRACGGRLRGTCQIHVY